MHYRKITIELNTALHLNDTIIGITPKKEKLYTKY